MIKETGNELKNIIKPYADCTIVVSSFCTNKMFFL